MSQKRKIKSQVACTTHAGDDYFIEDENGEEFAPHAGEMIRLRRKVPMMLFRIYGELISGDGERALVAFNDAIPMLAPLVAGWTWTDDNGDPMPNPEDDPDVLWRLDLGEITWIIEKLMEQTNAPKNSNSPSGPPPTA